MPSLLMQNPSLIEITRREPSISLFIAFLLLGNQGIVVVVAASLPIGLNGRLPISTSSPLDLIITINRAELR